MFSPDRDPLYMTAIEDWDVPPESLQLEDEIEPVWQRVLGRFLAVARAGLSSLRDRARKRSRRFALQSHSAGRNR